ncbi:hypothetical protein ACFWFZ_11735 [Streptomyces sp. NPDC060232]
MRQMEELWRVVCTAFICDYLQQVLAEPKWAKKVSDEDRVA